MVAESLLPDKTPSPIFNMCFLNPAFLPAWFWLPTAHKVHEYGHEYFIPDIPRDSSTAHMDAKIDVIEEAMAGTDNQHLVVLSRGVEYAVRYLKRLKDQEQVHKVVGWTVISSMGPRGYEVLSPVGNTLARHNPAHVDGIRRRDDGRESLNHDTAQKYMLHDIADSQLLRSTLDGMIPERPLTEAEIAEVPRVDWKQMPRVTWYIGGRDTIDNPLLSEMVAIDQFDVLASHRAEWGHVSPLTHTDQVAKTVIDNAETSYAMRTRES